MERIPRRLGLAAAAITLLAGTSMGLSRPVAPVTPVTAPVFSAAPPAQAVNPAPRETYGTPYEPLRPGTRLTYRLADGAGFTREVMLQVTIPWFDGTLREVIPVFDSRYDGCFLYRRQGDEIQVIGTWRAGKLERWGEYIRVLGPDAAESAPVATPWQQFDRVRKETGEGGPAWYAEGVGLVKTDEFVLVRQEQVAPRKSGM